MIRACLAICALFVCTNQVVHVYWLNKLNAIMRGMDGPGKCGGQMLMAVASRW